MTDPEPSPARLEVWGVAGIGEIEAGADLAAVIADAEPDLRDGDLRGGSQGTRAGAGL